MDNLELPHRGAGSADDRQRPAAQFPVHSQSGNRIQHQWESPVGGPRSQTAPVQQPKKILASQPTRDRADGPPVHHSAEVADRVGEKRSEPRPIPREFPPVVYLPCAETVEDPNDARIDMRETQDGRTALLAYSALDRLRECCGDDQAWIVVPTAVLAQLQSLHPFQLLMLDIEIPVEQRRGQK